MKPTQKQIATALGITARRVAQLKREGMPVDSIESAMLWREERATGEGSNEALRRERIRLVRAQAAKAEHQLEVERGKWVLRSDVDAEHYRIGVAVRMALLALEGALPPLLEGLEPGRMSKVLRDQFRTMLTRLADHDADAWPTEAEVAEMMAQRCRHVDIGEPEGTLGT